eukprot:1890539-Lingulodinium_polyedra.AAC.1
MLAPTAAWPLLSAKLSSLSAMIRKIHRRHNAAVAEGLFEALRSALREKRKYDVYRLTNIIA